MEPQALPARHLIRPEDGVIHITPVVPHHLAALEARQSQLRLGDIHQIEEGCPPENRVDTAVLADSEVALTPPADQPREVVDNLTLVMLEPPFVRHIGVLAVGAVRFLPDHRHSDLGQHTLKSLVRFRRHSRNLTFIRESGTLTIAYLRFGSQLSILNSMKLLVGLGNPESKYDLTRHNVGFLMLDLIAEQLGANWQPKPKFKGVIAEATIGGEKALLLKPTTYYNLTGEATRAVMDFYKLSAAEDVLVLHDELALPFGTLRTRLAGSDAGNNGIKSLIAHIGPQFARIRVGIASEHATRQDAADFVLGTFTASEQQALGSIAEQALNFVEHFVHHEKEFAPTSIRIET